MKKPKLLVLSSLFPSSVRPMAGLFIKQRMFSVAKQLPITVVSPVPWFPLQSVIRWWRPHYRPQPQRQEKVEGIEVYYPRFLALPGIGRRFDGFFMALACRKWLKRHPQVEFDLIDAHFTFPDGLAASYLSQWCGKPFSVTLRGTEVPHLALWPKKLMQAWSRANHIFSVSDSLKQVAIAQGINASKIQVVGNGVDTEIFRPVDKRQARHDLGLLVTDKVLVTVGGLVPRKGFHLVIECLAKLPERVKYVIVGGASAEGDYRQHLEQLAAKHQVSERVLFVGAKAPAELKHVLSAADVFVLASANEGWANVILEAMACGIPVIASDVGGNAEVVANAKLGSIYPFTQPEQLLPCIAQACQQDWDKSALIQYAEDNSWSYRVEVLVEQFQQMTADPQEHNMSQEQTSCHL
ncbi:glycosyltransferase [Motilimonas pumila]|uniref:Glycosyltransferase family 4 protein n=1 Tax=Motilimonas pumila TaxID=2303987 RepID=A0A418YHC7_9GAMM|nr:glycosyltransferase [Motilimonas pumila]RJG49457.1 glycosyltransferase family 4 protein [Motilimonas pumila]